jgi:hypothetical protein
MQGKRWVALFELVCDWPRILHVVAIGEGYGGGGVGCEEAWRVGVVGGNAAGEGSVSIQYGI